MSPAKGGLGPHRERTRARAWILQVFYGWETGGDGRSVLDALAATVGTRNMSPARRPYVERVLHAFAEHAEEIDERLAVALDNWSLERLSRIDRSILRLAATEILFLSDVPPAVTIQEGLRLAQRYGGDESARFVNGVLDALFRGAQVRS